MLLHKIKKIIFVIAIFQASHVYCMAYYFAKKYEEDGIKREAREAREALIFRKAQEALAKKYPLHQAVSSNNRTEVQRLLASGADVYQKDNNGRTPLRFSLNESVARALFSGAFSTRSPKRNEESSQKAAENMWVFEQFGEIFGETYDLPLPLRLLILSKLPERICSAEMVDVIVPLIPAGESLAQIIEACADKWLMRSEKFRARMDGDEKAMEAIADVRTKQTEPLLRIRSLNGSTPVDRMPELGSAAFKAEVRDERLKRLAAYLHKSEEIKT